MATEYTETFEQLLKDTSPLTPGILRSVALREFRLAAREFFEKSFAWTAVVPNIDTPAGNVPVQVLAPATVDSNGDADFADVVLLAHLDGDDGDTDAIDSSALANSLIFRGNAALTTAFKQFGTAALDANTGSPLDFIEVPHTTAFVTGSGDWTIEFWLNPQSIFGGDIINHGDGGSGTSNWGLLDANGTLQMQYSNDGGSFTNFPFFGLIGSLGVWHHIAVTRNGNDLFAHIDGIKSGATVDVTGLGIGGSGVVPINIGSRNQSGVTPNIGPADAYIDDVRFTVGTARYTTANFTPPTEAFPDVSNSADPNAEVIAILTLSLKNKPVGPFPARPPDDDPDLTSDVPRGWFVTSNPDEFQFFPRLETSLIGEAEALVALIPSFTATELPRQITLKYYDAIVDGYLARVYAHPNKPYSAPANAASLRHKFVREIGYYMAQRKQGYNNSQQWTYPRSWGVRRLGGNG